MDRKYYINYFDDAYYRLYYCECEEDYDSLPGDAKQITLHEAEELCTDERRLHHNECDLYSSAAGDAIYPAAGDVDRSNFDYHYVVPRLNDPANFAYPLPSFEDLKREIDDYLNHYPAMNRKQINRVPFYLFVNHICFRTFVLFACSRDTYPNADAVYNVTGLVRRHAPNASAIAKAIISRLSASSVDA